MTFFVSPTGNDANSGTKQHPFATLMRAQQALREARREAAAASNLVPCTVYLRGGTYAITNVIRFTPEDGGTALAPITYAAYAQEKPIISGGIALQGTWTPVPKKPYWQLAIPEASSNRWVFNTLYVNGESRLRARTPNWGEKPFRAEGREPGGDPRQALRYYAGDIDPRWTNLTNSDVVLLCSWTPTIHRITDIIPERRAIRFHSSHSRAVDAWETHFRYYIANVFEALDQPGEWYLNRTTGMLYYYPMPNEEMNRVTVVAPFLKSRLVEFIPDFNNLHFIEHLHFRDITFAYVDGDLDTYNGMYRQGHMFLDSALVAKGLRNSSFIGCTFSHLGEYAMELADACRSVVIQRCHFWDLGAGALQLGVTDLKTLKTPLNAKPDSVLERAVKQLTVDNTCIHRTGTLWHGCYGIVNRFASFTKITHNEIFDIHYTAIGLDARWDWKGETFSSGNEIAYNNLHHLGLRYHTDGAGIYQFGPLDTHIHHNVIHDTRAYPYICGYAGIYLDEQSRGARVENNLVYNTDWYAFFQHKGVNNIFKNNIGAFARDGFFSRGALNEHWKTNFVEVLNNIYVTSNNVVFKNTWEPGLRAPIVDSNLYYTVGAVSNMIFADKPFATWQKQGLDTHSVVAVSELMAPLSGDFEFKANAAGYAAIHFSPITDELRKAGLYGDPAWTTLAQNFTLRTPSATWSETDLAKLASISFDANLQNVGETPTGFQLTEQKEAGFAITRERPGTTGPQCIKVTDKKGLPRTFYPYLAYAPRGVKSGTITFSCALQLPSAQAVPLTLEFRGKGQTKDIGPQLAISATGVLQVAGRTLATLPADAWTELTITFTLGAAKTYDLTLTNAEGQKRFTLPFKNETFDQVTWIGIVANADADGCFYVDAIQFKLR